MNARWILSSCSLSLLIFACGGSGGDDSSAVLALTGPSQVSLITPDDSVVASGNGASSAPGGSAFPIESAYITDKASVYVYDPSMEVLDTINTILCTMDMTAYTEMVNKGDYRAQYELELCEGPDEDNSQGQSTGGVPETVILTASSQRVSNGSPQTMNLWLPLHGSHICAQMALTKGVTEQNPFGLWTVNWAQAQTASDLINPRETGYLQTADAEAGSIGFQFATAQGDISTAPALNEDASQVRVAVEISEDQISGSALISSIVREDSGGVDSGQIATDIKVVFDADHMKTQAGANPEVVLSRTSFHNSVQRYNLYHNTGASAGDLVELFSGFPFVTSGGNYGWMGYWGMWLESGVVSNGDTIYRVSGNGQQGEAHTVVKAPGKLIRNSRSQLLLTDLGNTLFEWWDMGTQYQVDYDGVDFRKIASYDNMNETWTPLGSPEVIMVASVGGRLHMWSHSLGGQVTYTNGDSEVVYFSQSFVNGSDDLFQSAAGGYVTLQGLTNCLDSNLLASEVESGSIYLTEAPNITSPHEYRFSEADLTLELDVNGDGTLWEPAGLALGETPTAGPFLWGFQSGPLVLDTSGLGSVGEIWDAPVYFTYETGHNVWNGYTAVQDAMLQTVEFDAPMQFLYTHSTANDMNADATFDGDAFQLSYNGPGDLHGFPYEEFDIDGDGNGDTYRPVINIEGGVTMGPSGSEYILRPMRIEQTLTLDLTVGAGASLNLSDADALTLPDLSGYVAPNIGDVPVVLGPPSVVNGVVTGGN